MPLQGLALPAEVWERDVLPRRVGAYSPAWMDQLCAARRDRLDRRRRARAQLGPRRAVLPRGPGGARAAAAASGATPGVAPRTTLSASGWRAGACFFTDLLVDVDLAPEELQEALWDLVWAGEATNDAFAPLRAPRLTLARAQRERARAAARARAVRGAPRGAAPARPGPGPLVADRAAVRARRVDPVSAPARARRAAARALRHRSPASRCWPRASPGGFSAIYSELSQLETLGVARRGYFVEGLGGAQFALPGRGRAAARAA